MYNDIDLSKLFYIDKSKANTVTDEQIKKVEDKIGYKLPESYLKFLKITNGGDTIIDECWLTRIYGLDELEEEYDLWINEWQYPKIGIPFGETQTAGHDIYFMDFREKINDEPRIIRIDQEFDYEEYLVTRNFEEFLQKLSTNENITGTSLKTKNTVETTNSVETTKTKESNNKTGSDLGGNIFAIILFLLLFIGSIAYKLFPGIIISSIFLLIFVIRLIIKIKRTN